MLSKVYCRPPRSEKEPYIDGAGFGESNLPQTPGNGQSEGNQPTRLGTNREPQECGADVIYSSLSGRSWSGCRSGLRRAREG